MTGTRYVCRYRTLAIISTMFAGISAATAGDGGWVCNAYGYKGARTTWHMVTGAVAGSKAAAEISAGARCYSEGLIACKPSGCWHQG